MRVLCLWLLCHDFYVWVGSNNVTYSIESYWFNLFVKIWFSFKSWILCDTIATMVVVNKQNEFCKLDNNVSQLESTKCSDCSNGGSDAVFTLCDNRGMLKLDQDLVINKGDINKIYRIDKGAPFATWVCLLSFDYVFYS